jgi:hypothetical protein
MGTSTGVDNNVSWDDTNVYPQMIETEFKRLEGIWSRGL